MEDRPRNRRPPKRGLMTLLRMRKVSGSRLHSVGKAYACPAVDFPIEVSSG